MENINVLRDLLQSMDANLEKLLAIENKKTAILEKGNVDDLNELMNTEQALIMECSSQEKQRIKLCTSLSVESVSELGEKYPETKISIEPIHVKLVETINSIKKVSALNLKLIDARMKIIKFMTAQFGMSQDTTQYGKNAQIV